MAVLGTAGLLLLAGCGKKTDQPVIALLTDDESGQASAQIQGAIYGADAQARVTHLLRLPTGDMKQAAYLLDQAVTRFPAGTIFVVATGDLAKHPLLLVRTAAKKYYLAPDDGVLSFVTAREGLGKAWQLDRGLSGKAGLDYLGAMAGLLAESGKPENLNGAEVRTLETLPVNLAHLSGRTIAGEIAHIDEEGTLLTNIPEKLASWMKEGNLLRFTVGRENFSAPLVANAAEVGPGRFVALFTQEGRLKIVRNKGSAAKQLGAAVGDAVLIRP